MRRTLLLVGLTCSLALAGPFEDRQKAGDAALQRKDYDTAIQQFERLVNEYPTSAEAHNALGYACFLNARYEKAIFQFKAALQYNPSHPSAQKNLILAAEKLAVERSAELEFQEALTLLKEVESRYGHHPLGPTLDYTRGQLEFYRSNEAGGLKAFKEVAARVPASGTAHFVKAFEFHKAGKLDEAGKFYELALKKLPNEAIFRNWYGLLLADTNKLDLAAAQFERALEDPPPYLDLRLNLARVYQKQGSLDKALVQLKSARQLRPDFASVHLWLAALYQATGDNDAAAREFGLAFNVDKRGAVVVTAPVTGTSVWIDGRYLGVTPIAGFIDEGNHVLKVQSPGQKPSTRELSVPAGKVAFATAGSLIELRVVNGESLIPPGDAVPAPTFQLKDRYNRIWRSFLHFHRRPVVLMFWEADSPSAIPALEALGALAGRHPEEIEVAAIHSDPEKAKKAQSLLMSLPADFAQLWGQEGKLLNEYGFKPQDLPAVVIVDLDGYIVYRAQGVEGVQAAEAAALKLLPQSTTPTP